MKKFGKILIQSKDNVRLKVSLLDENFYPLHSLQFTSILRYLAYSFGMVTWLPNVSSDCPMFFLAAQC